MENWIINSDGKLERTIQFSNFKNAIEFVNKVTELSEEHNHHPDIFIFDYKNVRITLFTHDQNSITEKDHELARAINMLK